MIITRSPLRITLGGGGTDLASYYRHHEGFLIAAAINRYVYVTVARPFKQGIYLKYSQIENATTVDDIRHPIIREGLRIMNLSTPQIEVTTLADIPAGTGLGSSGSFTTALMKSLYAHRRLHITQNDLAELACHIEIDLLHEPIGKQDQYIAAYGGITCFTFHKDGTVTVEPLRISMDTMFALEDNLLLFFTGYSRSAGSILKDQDSRTKGNDQNMLANLDYTKELGLQSRKALEQGHPEQLGELFHEHWLRKRQRSGGMTNPQIDEWYELALNNGAIGGKLVGAGGGGFLMFYACERAKLRAAMNKAGLEEVRFLYDFEGTKVVLS